mmetsp:Transcript_22234/g.29608  ORF Transcript_22234/g.29608 Transcript_22234/m.29608 type:complete len:282 (+) Transcript_22234:20-865(+)
MGICWQALTCISLVSYHPIIGVPPSPPTLRRQPADHHSQRKSTGNNNIISSSTTITMNSSNSNSHTAPSKEEENYITKLRNIGLHPKETPHHTTLPRASILIPIFARNNNIPYILLTQRPQTLSSHPGDVCFPGGRQDPMDNQNDITTALRETLEEVGIQPQHLTPLCRLATIESKNGLCVTPIVALVTPSRQAEPSHLTEISKKEVDAAFAVPLEYFLKEECDENYEVEWRGEKFIMRYYYFEEEEMYKRTFKIWGLTAHVAHQVATIGFGTDDEHRPFT